MAASQQLLSLFNPSSAPSAYDIRKVMLINTQFHWSDPRNHGGQEQALAGVVYNFTEPALSTCAVRTAEELIEDETRDPGIYIGQADMTLERLAIGSMNLGTLSDNSATHQGWKCSLILKAAHIHQDLETAVRMGESTMMFWSFIGPVVVRRMGLEGFYPMGLAQPQKVSKAPVRAYRVDLTVQFRYIWAVTTYYESHRLKLLLSTVNPTPP